MYQHYNRAYLHSPALYMNWWKSLFSVFLDTDTTIMTCTYSSTNTPAPSEVKNYNQDYICNSWKSMLFLFFHYIVSSIQVFLAWSGISLKFVTWVEGYYSYSTVLFHVRCSIFVRVLHQITTDIAHRLEMVRIMLERLQCNVFMLSYRGYVYLVFT